MMNTMKLPVGIDDFRKLRESDFYYVDKTRLIEQILQSWSEVTLFTRPRRFGKTLNMSMLKSFLRLVLINRCSMVCIFLGIKSFVKNIWESIRSFFFH